jgi:hypothetical protein
VLSEETWSDATAGCPGMDSGRLFEANEIAAAAVADGTSATRSRGRR